MDLKKLSLIIGICIGSITVATSIYKAAEWMIHTVDIIKYMHEFSDGVGKQIYQLDKRVTNIEEKI